MNTQLFSWLHPVIGPLALPLAPVPHLIPDTNDSHLTDPRFRFHPPFLAPPYPKNDDNQTPMKGHPVNRQRNPVLD